MLAHDTVALRVVSRRRMRGIEFEALCTICDDYDFVMFLFLLAGFIHELDSCITLPIDYLGIFLCIFC